MSQAQPRIVVRRKGGHEAAKPHGSWKIAYADFMTAMMAFFLVLWLVSLVPKEKLAGIAEYFRMPLMTAVTGGPRNDSGSTVIPGGSPSVIPNPNPVPSRGDERTEGDIRDQENLENLKASLEQLIESDPILKQFQPQLLLDMTPDGLRIQIVDKDNRPMFATGSARVQPYMRDILRQLGPKLNELPNPITVSGHTDSMPYAAGEREYSNWELSADRANAARRELVAGGMQEQKVKQVLGLAAKFSLVKDDPAAAVNRRISLLVLNRRAERRIDEQNAATRSVSDLGDLIGPMKGTAPTIPGGSGTQAVPAATPLPAATGASTAPGVSTPSPAINPAPALQGDTTAPAVKPSAKAASPGVTAGTNRRTTP
jgi:chemotaxis protein MotB